MTSQGVLASDLYKQESSASYRPIATFVQSLDTVLDGGIKPGLVTEIVGESGLGKTTFCLQLCLDVQIPQILQGLAAEALFIDTENSFVATRMEEMARAFVRHCNNVNPQRKGKKMSTNDVLFGIHVVKTKNLKQLCNVILSLVDYIKTNRKIRLVVIDSIAFPFYTQDDSFWGRTQPLYLIAQNLHYIASQFGIAIVVTNNITTRFDSKGDPHYVPYLGEMWYPMTNNRINLFWSDQPRARVAEIVKNHSGDLAKVYYKVTADGIRE